jgi:phosphoesterase RecJ-like protein
MQHDEFRHYAESARKIARLLESSDSIVITTHVRPDGDAIGSMLGLSNALRMLGKSPRSIVSSPVPAFLRFLPHCDTIEQYNRLSHDGVIATADIIVCVDFNHLSRIESMEPIVASSTARRVLIDHHLDPEDGFAAALHDTEVASTAELVFALLALEYPATVDRDVAIPLYVGIVTDTGSFRFPRVTSRTHRIVAALLDRGVDPPAIHQALFDTNTPARMRLLGEVLRSLDVVCDGRCAILTVTRSALQAVNATMDDTEGFVQHTLTIEGVQIGVFLSEMFERDAVKISIRSKGNADVRLIAERFGGGGHLNAAGAIAEGMTIEQVKAQIIVLATELLSARRND